MAAAARYCIGDDLAQLGDGDGHDHPVAVRRRHRLRTQPDDFFTRLVHDSLLDTYQFLEFRRYWITLAPGKTCFTNRTFSNVSAPFVLRLLPRPSHRQDLGSWRPGRILRRLPRLHIRTMPCVPWLIVHMRSRVQPSAVYLL